jgi:hypothetical protein
MSLDGAVDVWTVGVVEVIIMEGDSVWKIGGKVGPTKEVGLDSGEVAFPHLST